jgi:hypothetical protein
MAFDIEYLESGCTLPFDSATDFDGSAWTYITDYIIWACGVIITISILVRQGLSPNKGFVPAYFILSTTAYGIGGINHHITKRKDDPAYEGLWSTALVLNILGASPLLAGACSRILPGNKIIIYGCLAVGPLLALIGELTGQSFIIGAVMNVIAQLVLGVFWSKDAVMQRDPNIAGVLWASILKVTSVICVLAGTGVYAMHIQPCGSPGYEECFERCAFPNPVVFNHIAVFHFGLIASFLLHGIAEFFDPTILKLNTPAQDVAQKEKSEIDDFEEA